jgi:hypothetical protein
LGTCSRIATILDQEMLEIVHNILIAPRPTPDASLPRKSGKQVSAELGGRYLLRYLLPWQVGLYLRGSGGCHYVTPTPYTPEETISWLFLPKLPFPRPYAMLLDPSQISEILGPRWVRLGGGIEYILPNGFTEDALVKPWEIQVT